MMIYVAVLELEIDKRNAIWSYAPGDKSYHHVTHSAKYYQTYGTSLNPPVFG